MKLGEPVFNKPKALFGLPHARLMELIEAVARGEISADEAARADAQDYRDLDLLALELGVASATAIVPEESVAAWFRGIAEDSELLNDVRNDYRALVTRTRNWWYKLREEALPRVRLEYGEEAAQKYKAQTDRNRFVREEFWSEALTILDGKHPDLRWKNE